jgi:hypothetical protein
MSAVVEIKPETGKKLASLAQAKGVTVDELLYACVPGLAGNGNGDSASQSEKIQSFIEWAKTLPAIAPPLSDEAVSRRSIYER